MRAEPKLQRRQEASQSTRSHDENPRKRLNLTGFAYDRINGHNPRQSLEEFDGTYARMTPRPASSGIATTCMSPTTQPSTQPPVHAHRSCVIYVLDDRAPGLRPLGGAARWWLAQSLRRPAGEPARSVAPSLVLRKGSAPEVIAALARELDAGACTGTRSRNRRTRPSPTRSPRRSPRSVSPRNAFPAICWRRQPDPQQGEPGPARVHAVLATGAGARRSAETAAGAEEAERRARPRERHARRLGARAHEAGLGRRPARKLDARRGVGAGAPRRISRRRHVAGYAGDRDRPDRDGTSRLSPHLRFGEISPRQVWHAARFAAAEHPRLPRDIDKFLSEARLARVLPSPAVRRARSRDTQSAARLRRAFPWRQRRRRRLRAWQRGRTGYPIVDAGMRELWHTGLMHNRVRMIVASFLVKHLLIDWRDGEHWFWDTLVDADPGQQSGELAMGRRLRRRRRALLPRLQSGPAGREVRSRRRLCPALGAGAGATARCTDSSALDGDADRTRKRRRRTRQDLSAADRRSQGRARTRARGLCDDPRRFRILQAHCG